MNRVTTVYLLTCAAIGVAGGLLLWGTLGLSLLLTLIAPFVAVATAGLWLLPATVALRLLQRPLAGLLVGVISGIVTLPYFATNVWWAFFAEVGFLVVLYRFWSVWQHYAGALLVGVLYPILAAASYNLWSLPPWAIVVFFVLTIGSCLGFTWAGIAIADRLREAGVAKLARRRPDATWLSIGRRGQGSQGEASGAQASS